jgi:hypothetical protein
MRPTKARHLVTPEALLERVNRRLAPIGQRVVRCRGTNFAGVDVQRALFLDGAVDLVRLAWGLGCLGPLILERARGRVPCSC